MKIYNREFPNTYKYRYGYDGANGLFHLHRDGEPSLENHDGDKFYHQHNVLDRVDGAAVIKANGEEQFWLDGVRYTDLFFSKKF
jgi:hypothetical protein